MPDASPAPLPADVTVLPPAYGQLLVLTLVIGLHCSGMCGPLLLSFRFGLHREHRGGRLLAAIGQLGCYQAGRAIWYMAFGALAGGFAGILGNEVAQRLSGGVQWVGPVLALVFVLLAIGRLAGWRGLAGAADRSLLGGLGARWQALAGARPLLYAFGLGNLLAFLPCMVTGMVLLLAAGTGSVLHGALVMGLLVVLTTPALAPFALLPASLPRLPGIWAERLQTAAVCFTAVWMSLIALAANGLIPHAHWRITDDWVVMFF